jgi:hypothetical protein
LSSGLGRPFGALRASEAAAAAAPAGQPSAAAVVAWSRAERQHAHEGMWRSVTSVGTSDIHLTAHLLLLLTPPAASAGLVLLVCLCHTQLVCACAGHAQADQRARPEARPREGARRQGRLPPTG